MVMADVVMARVVMVHKGTTDIAAACIVLAWKKVMALSYPLVGVVDRVGLAEVIYIGTYSYGLCRYGLYSYGL